MVSVLAVSDETIESLWTPQGRTMKVDLVLGAGDLPFDYLEYLMDALDAPCVFVPGNHDPDLSGYSAGRVGWMRSGMPSTWPGPCGAVNADGRIVRIAGLRIAGLGGSIRYNDGPNQWTERQQRRRARNLAMTSAWHARRSGVAGVDVLLTHSPPRGVGDLADPPHRGFECFEQLAARLQARTLVHGHVHPYGTTPVDRVLGSTTVINTVGFTLMEMSSGTEPTIVRRRHGT
ncbi:MULTISPECIES: metallophosphoesterase [Rhodococcus]|uniref:Metallophosphoesterase n=1 Tax=Rhodococcus oxybenzonivorans TaxID=1990687 RepID=A0AAE5A6S9_9NOCA|nr:MULTISPECIES: metallophosphoesterase [Rhodococcus]MDV7245679.1 metallophosphoesterase [Rhodococcus oxybenzonivorans]MDV7265897.1 metallophosphoesterase [Rhodococcus oxybenzonivorans]MDV7276966.1 metallophosphoesterase [Rhodococcus oxybenzonivorans]MDV7336702.1 metallophosphoesterase [Rhodococcus oxybenzonivorans]MDV7346580.1 metallophosphoesterase [Rhodococcus oxybenzonivorans]